ncbi:alpha-ketoglutarate-dependent-dichlorophenoxyacetate dioxygenase [Diplodia corticola]|uniref:Alpha-ketoglutarate-dependent-dichlorophenoxyacetate dioxygenase n=1 Tax=Diplodia corticola TaxID=236234 RepID=A0A1J9RID7_9PEZI|nr:alpha-ketoglutarate-dependent-dichlorophenoxyacetate dioxygenase [Diplodia corticola]OJD32323.1 alpha-ketoglutarate-dependent-dichlorophenoxyacetate dioxygenase [Diplodia corticola]
MPVDTTETIFLANTIPKIRELTPGFGAEVHGLNFDDGATEDGYCLIQELVKKYGVVVIRKTNLNDESHIQLARKFGELDDVRPYKKAGRKNRLKYDELFDVSNIDTDGTIIDRDSPRAQANKGNSLFHVDSSFNPRRAGYSLLLAHELPRAGTGGSTEFCDTRAAWDDLDQQIKTEILEKDYVACHSMLHSRKLAAPDFFAEIEPENYPMGRHKLVQKHERSGRMNLYLAMHIHHIEGLEPEQSRALFDRLITHATNEKYRAMVEWHNVGDLVVWDNTCTMHRAVGGDFAYKDSVGEPKRPPCVSCNVAGSECVLVKSKRGGNFRSNRRRKETVASAVAPTNEAPGAISTSSTRGIDDGAPSEDLSEGADGEHGEQMIDESLHMKLTNPSDALHILALSGETSSSLPVGSMTPANRTQHPDERDSSTTVLDDYELVQRGLLHPSVLPELLHIYAHDYHPFCPIVPSYLLGESAMHMTQRSDYFLLTVMLTIASRDSPSHSLAHRYCWDHTQRLLLEILLAYPWAQTPRTVEGLLLLSEWLPHTQIKQTTSEAPKNLFSEDMTAWSLIGLAVRQGYSLRLDRAAFRGSGDGGSNEQEEQKRLIWIFVFLADRQISARLGQSFWSRGPSLSSQFTAKDFPSLRPGGRSGRDDEEDYASALHATIDLTQILHNAHATLYSSPSRTLAMIHDGDYARYLDDLLRATDTWHSTWATMHASHKVKSTILLTYEYIRLYITAFSFQAVLTRSSSAPRRDAPHPDHRPLATLFSRGIAASPDGRYISDAIGSAIGLLRLFTGLDPHAIIRFLPSRYYLYGVYAAVILHKAHCLGAFQHASLRDEVADLATRFVSVMQHAAAGIDAHIARGYSRVLGKLWCERRASSPQGGGTRDVTEGQGYDASRGGGGDEVQASEPMMRQGGNQGGLDDGDAGAGDWEVGFDATGLRDDDFVAVEEALFGAFFPGITVVGQQDGSGGIVGSGGGLMDGWFL